MPNVTARALSNVDIFNSLKKIVIKRKLTIKIINMLTRLLATENPNISILLNGANASSPSKTESTSK